MAKFHMLPVKSVGEKVSFLQKLADATDGDAPEGVEGQPEGAQPVAAPQAAEGAEGAPVPPQGEEGPAPAPTPEDFMQVLQFMGERPNPSDDDFHAFAANAGLNVHSAETCAYRLATLAAQFLLGGRSKDAGLTYNEVQPEALQQGMQVEMEHGTSEIIAKKIALDHLAESMTYYDELAKMENAIKQNAGQVVATPVKPDGAVNSPEKEEEAGVEDETYDENEKTSAFFQKIAKKIIKQPGWKKDSTGMFGRGTEIAEEHPTDTVSNRQYRKMESRRSLIQRLGAKK